MTWASFPQWMVILLIVLILFGGDKIPKLAKDLGKSIKAFKRGLNEEDAEGPKASDPARPAGEKTPETEKPEKK